MAAIVIDANDGIHNIAARAATTVQEMTLPKWTRRVSVAVRAGGADLEVAWSGTDGAASFSTATLWVLCPGGSSLNDLEVPHKYVEGNALALFIRCQATTSTNIDFVCTSAGL
jgi:hypothetical protein